MKYYHQDDLDTHYTWDQMVSMAGTEDQVLVEQYIRNNGYKAFTEGDTVSSQVEGLTDNLVDEAAEQDSTYDEFEAALNIKPPVDPYAEVDYTTHTPVSVDPVPEVNITDATLPSVFEKTIQDFATRNNIDLGEGGATRAFIPKTYNMHDIVGMMERKGNYKEKSAAKYLSKILNLETVDLKNPLSILSQEEEGAETALETIFGSIEVVQTDKLGDQLAIFVNGKEEPYMLDLNSNTFDAWKKNLQVISTIQEAESILTGDALKNSWAGGFVRNLMDLGKRNEGYSLSEVNKGLEYAGYRITGGTGRGYNKYINTPVLEKKNSEGKWEVVFTPDLSNVERGRITGEPLTYTDENLLVSPTQTGYKQISTFLENNIDTKGRDKLLQYAFDLAVVNNNKAEQIRLKKIKPNISPTEVEKEIFALPQSKMEDGNYTLDWDNKNLGVYWETLKEQVNTLRKQELISDTQVEAFYSWMDKNFDDSMNFGSKMHNIFQRGAEGGKGVPNTYNQDPEYYGLERVSEMDPKNRSELMNRFKSLGGLENEPGNVFEFVNDKGELKAVNLKTLLMTPMLQGGDLPSFFEDVNYDSGVEKSGFFGPMMAPNNFVKVLYNQEGARLLDQKSSGPVGLLFKSEEKRALLELGTAMIRKDVQMNERNMEIIRNMLPALKERGNEIYKGGINKLEELLDGIDAPTDYQFIISGDDYFVQVSTGMLDKPLSKEDQKRYNQATQVANDLTMLVNDMQVSQNKIMEAYGIVNEKQGKYLKETGYTEQLGRVSSLEYGTGDLVGQDFASGFNSLWLTAAGIFNPEYAKREQRKENLLTQYVFQPQADYSISRGMQGGGFFEGVELEDGEVYREPWLNTFRFGAQQSANTLLALSMGGIGRAWARGSSLKFGMQGVDIATRASIAVPFGISSYGDTWRNLNIQQDMVEIAKSNQINLDKAWNDGDIDSSFSYSRQTAQNNLLIAQNELTPLQIHAASASNAAFEIGFTYAIGTGRNTAAFYDDIASFKKLRSSLNSTKIRQILEQHGATDFKTFGQLPLIVQAKIVGLYGKEWVKRQGREILEEEAIEFNQQVVTQGLILANPIDFSRMDDVAFSALISSAPMNTSGVIINAANTVGTTIKNTEVINAANNKIDGWLGELENLHGNNKKKRSEIFMLINEQFKILGFENFKMTAQTLALGKDKIYELMQLNEMKVGLWLAAGVTPGMNQKQVNDQINKYRKGLNKSDLELFDKQMSNIEGSIAEAKKNINWEAAKSNLGATWTSYNTNLNDKDNVYKGLKNDQERIAYILQKQRQDQIDHNIEKAQANATNKEKKAMTDLINKLAEQKKADGVWGRVSKKRMQELEDQLWAFEGLNQYLYQGKALTASIRTNIAANKILNKTSLNYIEATKGIEIELNNKKWSFLSPKEKKQIIEDYNKENGYGALITLKDGSQTFIVKNKKNAMAAVDNDIVPAGTVRYHEYRHAVDILYFDGDPSKINDYSERLFGSIWNHNRNDRYSSISKAGMQGVKNFLSTKNVSKLDASLITILFLNREVNNEGDSWNEDGTLTEQGKKVWNQISDIAKDELAKRIEESIFANIEYVKDLVKTPGIFGRGKIFIEEAILGKVFGKMLVNTNDKALDFAISNALAFEKGETSIRERARGIELKDIGAATTKPKAAKKSGEISGESKRAKSIIDNLGFEENFKPGDRRWDSKFAAQVIEIVSAWVNDKKHYGSQPVAVKEELIFGAISGLYRDGKDGKNEITRFDPNVNDSLYGYLMGRIQYRVGDVWNKLYKDKIKTISLDKIEEKTEAPSVETKPKRKRKPTLKEETGKEIDAFFGEITINGKRVATDQTFIDKIVRAIDSTLRTRLEGKRPGSKEYRKIIRDEISKAIAIDMENLMYYGTRDQNKIQALDKKYNAKELADFKYTNAITFIKENAEAIVNKLDITTINYSYSFLAEKLRDENGKIKRYSAAESRQYNDDIDKGYIKGQKIKDIYSGNAQTIKKAITLKLLKEWMNYFTDPSIAENTRDGRIVALAKIISEELGQDLVPNVIRSLNPNALIEAEIEAVERSMSRPKYSAKILGKNLYRKWVPQSGQFKEGLYNLFNTNKLTPINIEKLHRAIYIDKIYDDYHKKVANFYSISLKPFTNIRDKTAVNKNMFLTYAQEVVLNEDTGQSVFNYVPGTTLNAEAAFEIPGMVDIARAEVTSGEKKQYTDEKNRNKKDELLQQAWTFGFVSHSASSVVGKGWKKVNGKWILTKRKKGGKDLFSGAKDFYDNYMKVAFPDIQDITSTTITLKDGRVLKRKYKNPKASIRYNKNNITELEGDNQTTKDLRKAAWVWNENVIKNLKGIDPDVQAMILTSLNDGTATALRIAAPLYGHATVLSHRKWDGKKFIVFKEWKKKDGEFVLENGKKIPIYENAYRWEHSIPARLVLYYMYDNLVNGNKLISLKNLQEDYRVTIIPIEMDNVITATGFSKASLANYIPGVEPWWKRMYNPFTMGRIQYGIKAYDSKKKIGMKWENYYKGPEGTLFKVDAKEQNIKNSIADKAMRNARNPKYSGKVKGISVLDFDDTIADTKEKIIVNLPYYAPGSTQESTLELTPAEFAEQAQRLESMGAAFDFSQFESVKGAKKGPLFNRLQKAVGKFGNENVFILTARPQTSAKAIQQFLQRLGVKLKVENIIGLEDGTSQAKANWFVQKVSEGYNDFYFADDILKNVKAVKKVLDVLDVKSKVQQARAKFSGALSKNFNDMIERHKGIGSEKVFSKIKAKMEGKRPFIDLNIIIPPSADDFRGLTQYTFVGKGKQGEADQAWFDKALIKPYTRGIAALEREKYALSNSYQTLKKANPEIAKILNQKIPGSMFSYEDAIRVSLWVKAGIDLTDFGLSKRDAFNLNKIIKNDPQLNAFAEGLLVITKRSTYIPPREGWEGSSIIQDLNILNNKIQRKEFLSEFIENVNIIFSKDNLNKVEAIYGAPVRTALEDSIYRMTNGTNRSSGNNALTNKWLNWLNNAVGSIMFLNRRSALLQLVSTTNFINWSDNNMLKAAMAFANQPQYWKDVLKIMFSPKLKLRRAGLKGDVNEAEIASTVAKADNKFDVFISIMLKHGFILTQIADSLAIALGGATYYRNRLNTYLKQNMDPDQAEQKAWEDFSDISDEVQQSADPLLVSREQASNLGRLVLAFQNVTMQMVRKSKKAALDLINGRGNPFTNISKIIYYTFVQNLVFNTLQQALFAILPGFSDDDEEERAADEEKRIMKIINNMSDTLLRGSGLRGAIISTLKNVILEYNKQEGKPQWQRDHAYTLIQLLNISPPIGSKARKVYGAIQTKTIFEKDVIAERGFDVMIDGKFQLSSSYSVLGSITSAFLNIPLDRLVDEINGITESLDARNTAYQRIALALGWRTWDVNARIEEHDVIKAAGKARRKKEGIEKGKKTRAENKRKDELLRRQAWDKLTQEQKDSIKINRELKIEHAINKALLKLEEINF